MGGRFRPEWVAGLNRNLQYSFIDSALYIDYTGEIIEEVKFNSGDMYWYYSDYLEFIRK